MEPKTFGAWKTPVNKLLHPSLVREYRKSYFLNHGMDHKIMPLLSDMSRKFGHLGTKQTMLGVLIIILHFICGVSSPAILINQAFWIDYVSLKNMEFLGEKNKDKLGILKQRKRKSMCGLPCEMTPLLWQFQANKIK